MLEAQRRKMQGRGLKELMAGGKVDTQLPWAPEKLCVALGPEPVALSLQAKERQGPLQSGLLRDSTQEHNIMNESFSAAREVLCSLKQSEKSSWRRRD